MKPDSAYGLAELLAVVERTILPQATINAMCSELTAWYHKWTRLETFEEKLKPGASAFQEQLVEVWV